MWLGNIAVEMGEELYFEVLKRQIGYIYTKLLVSGENKPQHTNKHTYTEVETKALPSSLMLNSVVFLSQITYIPYRVPLNTPGKETRSE